MTLSLGKAIWRVIGDICEPILRHEKVIFCPKLTTSGKRVLQYRSWTCRWRERTHTFKTILDIWFSPQIFTRTTYSFREFVHQNLLRKDTEYWRCLPGNTKHCTLINTGFFLPQISFLQAALVFVWFLGVSSFPTIKDKKDSYSKITHQNTKHKELVDQLFSKWTNEMTVKLRRRRALTPVFPSVPTYTDRGELHCKTHNMLAIFSNGTVRGIHDLSSPFGKGIGLHSSVYSNSVTRWCEDMRFIFERWKYFTSERCGRMKCFQHER